MKSNIRPSAIAVFSLTLCLSAHSAVTYTSIYAFGDSLSDSGNVYAATGGAVPSNPLNFPGRFGNGPTWVEKVATDHLGLPAISPSLLGGTNHAWGGAWTDGGGSVPSVLGQINQFTMAGGSFASNDLVTIWAGANDLFSGVTDVASMAGNLGSAMVQLSNAGATNILFLNLPDLGKTPDIQALGAPTAAGMSALVLGFNALLADEITNQRLALGINIFEFDAYALSEDVSANLGSYGFTNDTDPASEPGNEANADFSVFWDGVHPTDRMHDLYALGAARAVGVPEPSSILLVFSASLAVMARRRRVAA